MLLLPVVILLGAISPMVISELVIDDEEMVKIWHHFKLKYNKQYDDPNEDQTRRELFERNLEKSLVKNLEDDRKLGRYQPGLGVEMNHQMDHHGYVMFKEIEEKTKDKDDREVDMIFEWLKK